MTMQDDDYDREVDLKKDRGRADQGPYKPDFMFLIFAVVVGVMLALATGFLQF
ncbi:hypothetical protein HH800_00845 [Sphingobium yanoikuyae]|uniref:Uncharacterized protein n=1 Tax=Sphingobium yanoikuyae TaxID=13690 RepID=A0A6M4G596_SPHYA|nr:hypothetical protein [Sphingobium yanoikuyae]QJR00867.1 hypothetical protein HH800_00845 [Sphingobium yanoikuyae]